MNKEQLRTAFFQVKGYRDILDLLWEAQGVISQKEIAIRLNRSQTLISKKIKVLSQYGAIEKVKPRQYRVVEPDHFIEHSPFGLVLKLIQWLEQNPDKASDFKSQSKKLGVEMKEIQRAWGFINQIFE